MFKFFKKNTIRNDTIIPISWNMLNREQKMQIANIVLKDEKVNINGICGDIETAMLIECTGTGIINGITNFTFLTSNSFYNTVNFTEKQIISKWLHFNKYGNKNYSNII